MTVNSTLIITDEIYKNGSKIKGINKGDTEIQRAYCGDTLIYDMWNTVLMQEEEVYIEATEYKVSSFLEVYSYGIDYDGNQHNLEYTYDVDTIPKNDDEVEKTHTVVVRQTLTGETITVKVIQAAKESANVSYGTPVYTGLITDEVEASGGTAYAYANFTQTKTTYYTNGDTETEEVQGQSLAYILGGTKGEGEVELVDGAVEVKSAENNTYKGNRLVYTISKIAFESYNGSIETSAQAYIYQSENQLIDTVFSTPVITATYAADVTAAGGASVLTAKYSQTKTLVYTSLYEESSNLSGTFDKSATSGAYIVASGTASITGAALNTTRGTSYGNITANSLGYLSKVRTAVYTVNITGYVNDKSGSSGNITVYQAANTVHVTYASPTYTSITVGTISATGVGVQPKVNFSQVKTTTSTAIPTGKSETVTGSVAPTSLTGTTIANGGTYTASTNTVSAANLLTTLAELREVYRITAVTYTANEVLASKSSLTVAVNQAANTRWVTSTSGGVVTYGTVTAGTITNKTIPASGGEATATAGNGSQAWSKTKIDTTYTYTTGSTKTETTTAATSGSTAVSPSHSSVTGTALQKPATASGVTTIASQAVTWTGQNNKSASGTMYVYQAANVITTYGSVTVTSHGSASDIPASGGTIYGSGGTGKQTITYTSGATRAGTVTCGTYSGVSGSHLYATLTVRTFKGDSTATLTGEGSKTATVTVAVYQQANTRSTSATSTGSHVLTVTNTETTNIANTGGTMSVTIASYRKDTYTWTSGSTDTTTVNYAGTIAGTNCTVSATSFAAAASTTVSATVAVNPLSSTRSCTITVTSNSTSKSASRTQNASVFALTLTKNAIAYSAGTYEALQVVSTRNGSAYSDFSVSVSGISGAYYSSKSLDTSVSTTGLYKVYIYFPLNSSTTSSRSLTVAVAQTNGKSASVTLTQDKYPKPTKTCKFTGTFSYRSTLSGVDYTIISVSNPAFSAVSDDVYDYNGGTADVKFIVSNKSDGTGDALSTKTVSSVSVAKGGTTSITLISLSNPNGTSSTQRFVLICWGDTFLEAHAIDDPGYDNQ